MMPAALTALLVCLVGRRLRPRPYRCVASSPIASSPPCPRPGVATPPRRRFARRRHVEADPADIAAWCDRLARAIRSGATLTMAIRSIEPPVSDPGPVGEIVLRLGRGVPLSSAVDAATGHPHLDVAATVIRACAVTGGPSAEPLDRAAAALRGRAAEAAERRGHSAQARLSAVVMTVLPLAMLAVLLTTSSPVRTVVATPLGALVVISGGAINVVGWRWMRRIITVAAR